MRRSLGRSPLGCYVHSFVGIQSSASMSGGLSATESTSLYPMPVPYPDFVEPPSRRGLSLARFRQAACRHGVNILVGYFNFLELGCPRKAPPLSSRTLTAAQRIASENLLEDMLGFVRSDCGSASATCAGGRARLAQQLLVLTEAAPGEVTNAIDATVALPVNPERVALPEVGGTIDPANVLPPHLLRAFLNWERDVRLHHSNWPSPLPRSCHTHPRELERDFIRELLRRQMGILIRAQDVPVDPSTGQPILSGFFCVTHKAHKDRLINDKRCPNETERALRWLSLPGDLNLACSF